MSPTIGILREAYSCWERRSPFTPNQVRKIVDRGINVIVQPCTKRVFPDTSYRAVGATIANDLTPCTSIFGVKQPSEDLIPNKTYLFFSHTIKGQLENMDLLDSLRENNVRLIDYECITKDGVSGAPRLVAFGEYAGKAGMISTFRGLGQQLVHSGISSPFLNVGSAYMYPSYEDAANAVRKAGCSITNLDIPRYDPLVFLFTGTGNVNRGARSVFNLIPHEMVAPDDLEHAISSKAAPIIGCQVDLQDMLISRGNHKAFDKLDYYQHPELYESVFYERFANKCNVLVNGMYWDARYPRLVTKSDLSSDSDRRLHFISDISCDVGGGVEVLDRATTVEEPFFNVSDPKSASDIMVMGVDILPSELPKEASQHFGDFLLPFVPQLAEPGRKTDALAKELQGACIVDNGELLPRYTYIEKLRRERCRGLSISQTGEFSLAQIEGSTVIRLWGHLFDTGLINKMLDIVEERQGRFHIVECLVGLKRKSTVILQITMDEGRKQLDSVLSEIEKLAEASEDAEAVFDELPDFCAGDYRATLVDSSLSRSGSTKDTASNVDGQYLVVPSLQTVLVLGAGLVAKPAVELLSRDSSRHVIVASGLQGEARSLCNKVGRSNLEPLTMDVSQSEELERLVGKSDAVISLLPQTMHTSVAKLCISHKVPLVTASYVLPEMRDLEQQAIDKGVPIICEMGLDPGLDHMSAMSVIDSIQESGEKVQQFTSLCGGLPAPESANNPFGYKFSWSPRGVLMAMKNDAKYLSESKVIEVNGGADLLASASPFRLHMLPSLALEVLPNRNSLVYQDVYNIEAATCFRGTLRYEGWSETMIPFVEAGFLRDDVTFKDALAKLGPNNKAMDWLLDSSDLNFDETASAIDVLSVIMHNKLELQKNERDLVLMEHKINGHVSSLMIYGDEADSAMARTVGLTVGIGADLVLDGTTSGSGIILPTDKRIYQPGLERLVHEGISFTEF